ncbi:MAG: hypothetical protein FWE80_05430 [Oscillospiraceae bacterium]|nr:hypothetical protein [Oscillospiraceae bacterium]
MRDKDCFTVAGAAFGAGLLVATLCPARLILVLAAAALVVIGAAKLRSC